jgi:hypothetical protein
MGLGVGLTTLPCKKNCLEAFKKFSRILWRRPRPKLGCGAKERRRRKGKVVPVLLTEHHAMKAYWGVDV